MERSLQQAMVKLEDGDCLLIRYASKSHEKAKSHLPRHLVFHKGEGMPCQAPPDQCQQRKKRKAMDI